MNSLPGGASIPNATPSPNTPSTTIHHQSPHPGRAKLTAAAGATWTARAEPGKESATGSAAPALRSPPRGPEAAGRWAPRAAPALARPARWGRALRPPPPGLPARFFALPGPGAPPVGPRTSSSCSTFRDSLWAQGGGGGKRVRGKRPGVPEATWRSGGAEGSGARDGGSSEVRGLWGRFGVGGGRRWSL